MEPVESDFTRVFKRYKEGCGSISDIVEHVEFQCRLRQITYGFNYTIFRGERDGDDIRQEISMRLYEEELNCKLWLSNNVETEAHLLTWLFVLTRNHYYSLVRHHRAQKRDGLRADDPVEDCDVPFFNHLSDPILESNEERDTREAREDAALDGFPEFISRYPLVRQWAIRRWLKNKSYRRIQKMLQRLGCHTSYVTVGNWINATIEDYAKHLNESPRTQRRTGT